MNLLAIDTTTDACLVALQAEGQRFERRRIAPRQHAALVLPMVDELFTEAAMPLSDIAVIAFAAGPGSFTGLRIAAAITQGLAFGADVAVLPLSSLQIVAQSVYAEHGVGQLIVAENAHMGEMYWNCYRLDGALMQATQPDQLISPEAFALPAGEDWHMVGSAWDVYGELLAGARGKFRLIDDAYPSASALLDLACGSVRQGALKSARQALPVYLRGAGAWKTVEQQRG